MIMMIVMILITEGAFLLQSRDILTSELNKWLAQEFLTILNKHLAQLNQMRKKYNLKKIEKWKWLTSISQGYCPIRCLLWCHFRWKWLFTRSGVRVWVLSMWHGGGGGIYMPPLCTHGPIFSVNGGKLYLKVSLRSLNKKKPSKMTCNMPQVVPTLLISNSAQNWTSQLVELDWWWATG